MGGNDFIGRAPADLLPLDTQVKENDLALTCEPCQASNGSERILLARRSVSSDHEQ